MWWIEKTVSLERNTNLQQNYRPFISLGKQKNYYWVSNMFCVTKLYID